MLFLSVYSNDGFHFLELYFLCVYKVFRYVIDSNLKSSLLRNQLLSQAVDIECDQEIFQGGELLSKDIAK